jgi:quinol monooxygenase YgiN
MVIVLGKVHVEPADLGTFVEAAKQVEAGTRQEAGCLSYAFGQDLADPLRFWLCESWTDSAALDAHGQTAHIAAFRAAIAGIRFRQFIVMKYDASNESLLMSR